jgi:hypothetical protein
MLEIFGRHKITRATDRSRNNLRHAINCVMLDGLKKGRPRLIATDGKILGVIPLHTMGKRQAGQTGKPDVDGLIDHDAFDRAMAGTRGSEHRRVHFGEESMEVRDSKGNLIVSVPRSKAKGDFPDYEKVIPRPRAQEHVLKIVPSQLGKLTAVLGIASNEAVALHFDTNADGIVDSAIRVTQQEFAGDLVPHGVIMPGSVDVAQRAQSAKLEKVTTVKALPEKATAKA